MNITPLEIRQKEFEKVFRGYDKDEVAAFLSSMSQEWERAMDTQKELKIKLEGAEKEVDKLRQVENSLYKTLKTAEDTGANVVSQANKTAELHLKETQMKADQLIQEASIKAHHIVENAIKRAQAIMTEMEEEVQELTEGLKSLEQHRENITEELKNLSAGLQDRVKKVEDRVKHIDVETHLKRARNAVKKVQNAKYDQLDEIETVPLIKKEKVAEKEEILAPAVSIAKRPQKGVAKETGEDTSFFDDI
ncbi:MAG: cell division initiation protein [Marivirga sp.]|jgi:cell division initiation protein